MPRFHFDLVSDEDLLVKIRDNNSEAFKALFNRYYRPLCKFIRIYIRDEALSEEIISDVFVSLWAKRSSSAVQHLKHYLFVAARNQSFNHLKKRSLPVTYSDAIEDYEYLLQDNTSPLTIIHSREAQKEILSTIQSLPLRQREILMMSRISGIEHAEIAQYLGISVKTVQATLYEAVRELRSKLFRREKG